VFDGRCAGARAAAVTRRKTGKNQTLFIVVFAQYPVVAKVVAIANAEPTKEAKSPF